MVDSSTIPLDLRTSTNYFLDGLFAERVCLSKMDFIIMLQSPNCSWIFDQDQIRTLLDQYYSTSSQDVSTKSDSPQTEQNFINGSGAYLDVHAKMVEEQDELQYCHYDNGDENDNIDIGQMTD